METKIIAHTTTKHTATHLEGRLINTETGEVLGFASVAVRTAKNPFRYIKNELTEIAERKGIMIDNGDDE